MVLPRARKSPLSKVELEAGGTLYLFYKSVLLEMIYETEILLQGFHSLVFHVIHLALVFYSLNYGEALP